VSVNRWSKQARFYSECTDHKYSDTWREEQALTKYGSCKTEVGRLSSNWTSCMEQDYTLHLCMTVVPSSERKGLANRKCFYVCPANQTAAFLNKRGKADFRFETEWN
jgi:hypothetical protein